ncbi:Predicted esterase [Serratia fonticola]|uniref:Predicted esterase n=1 Tax=Serratia fonticola TaxID=47917 RepID=A0A4U9VNA6_SERFO|nr:Predicted esterase [Serratia fonticola]
MNAGKSISNAQRGERLGRRKKAALIMGAASGLQLVARNHMIIYLHGFDSTSPGNHEKIMQLQFIDPDVRFISYSTFASAP